MKQFFILFIFTTSLEVVSGNVDDLRQCLEQQDQVAQRMDELRISKRFEMDHLECLDSQTREQECGLSKSLKQLFFNLIAYNCDNFRGNPDLCPDPLTREVLFKHQRSWQAYLDDAFPSFFQLIDYAQKEARMMTEYDIDEVYSLSEPKRKLIIWLRGITQYNSILSEVFNKLGLEWHKSELCYPYLISRKFQLEE